MGNLFRRKKQASSPPSSRIKEDDMAIAQLKVTRDKLKAYQRKLESNIGALKAAIKTCLANKQKTQALLALRKQKFIEKNLSSTHGELLNIDSLILNVENAQIQSQVVKALAKGNEILTKMNKELTVEDVDKLMAQTDEAIEYQNQIGLALSQQGIPENEDLLSELDNLEVDPLEIPSVPTYKLEKSVKVVQKPEKEEKEEEEEEVKGKGKGKEDLVFA